jgi:hypothetical protein
MSLEEEDYKGYRPSKAKRFPITVKSFRDQIEALNHLISSKIRTRWR